VLVAGLSCCHGSIQARLCFTRYRNCAAPHVSSDAAVTTDCSYCGLMQETIIARVSECGHSPAAVCPPVVTYRAERSTDAAMLMQLIQKRIPSSSLTVWLPSAELCASRRKPCSSTARSDRVDGCHVTPSMSCRADNRPARCLQYDQPEGNRTVKSGGIVSVSVRKPFRSKTTATRGPDPTRGPQPVSAAGW